MALDPQRDFSTLGELAVLNDPPGHHSPSEVMYPGGPGLDGGLLAPGDPLPENAGPGGRRPEWLKVRVGVGETYASVHRLMRAEALHTVCEEARCPNQGECWALGTATFMVLGSVCTRNCGFCAIDTGRPLVTDLDEPRRVGEAARRMNLKHAVVTMVARDDLPDGGAEVIADTIRQIRLSSPATSIEVLISDLNGREADIRTVVEAQPEILNHNVETVPRLQRPVRRRARWERSVSVLTTGRRIATEIGHDGMVTKTGLMVGLGERWDEVIDAMRLLHEADIDVLTIGQYLRPSRQHLPLHKYYTPAEFLVLRRIGLELGFKHVQSGPLVRSSYHAAEQVPGAPATGAVAV
ncbi:MAG TPA: lipoyl synthase [Candidatus Saccharimonadales bacterium]|nr:lipoyl synthase [Candidatus Saccharimonadales bacterium]